MTSRPSGKWRSIFLMGGLQSSFLRTSWSSTLDGDVFNFLWRRRRRKVSLAGGSRIDVWTSGMSTTTTQRGRITTERTKSLPSKLLGLWCNLELHAFLLCYWAQFSQLGGSYFGQGSCLSLVYGEREREREEGRAIHTKIIDVEHAAHSATCPAVPDLGLGRRGRCIINGRVNLGQGGQRFLHFSGHDG